MHSGKADAGRFNPLGHANSAIVCIACRCTIIRCMTYPWMQLCMKRTIHDQALAASLGEGAGEGSGVDQNWPSQAMRALEPSPWLWHESRLMGPGRCIQWSGHMGGRTLEMWPRVEGYPTPMRTNVQKQPVNASAMHAASMQAKQPQVHTTIGAKPRTRLAG